MGSISRDDFTGVFSGVEWFRDHEPTPELRTERTPAGWWEIWWRIGRVHNRHQAFEAVQRARQDLAGLIAAAAPSKARDTSRGTSGCRCGLPVTATLTEALGHRFDQLIGWAKAGQAEGHYLMDVENVDSLCDDLIGAVREELMTHGTPAVDRE